MGRGGIAMPELTSGTTEPSKDSRIPWPVLAAVAVVAVPLALIVPEEWSKLLVFDLWVLLVLLRAVVAAMIAAPVLWLMAPKHQKVKTGSLVLMWLWFGGAYWQISTALGGGEAQAGLVFLGAGVLLGFLRLRYGPKWEQEWLQQEGRRLLRTPRRTGWERAREVARNLLTGGGGDAFLRWEGIRIILLAVLAGILLLIFRSRAAMRVSVAFILVFAILVWNWLRLWSRADKAQKTSAFNLTFLFLVFLAITSPLLGFSDIELNLKFMGREVHTVMVTDSCAIIALSAVRAFWGRKWEKEMADREAATT